MGAVGAFFFLKLAYSNFSANAHSQAFFVLIAVAIVISMGAVAIIGLVGMNKQMQSLLITYAVIVSILFFCFWGVFAYMKVGKGIFYLFIKLLEALYNQFSNLCYQGKSSGFLGELQKAYPANLASTFCSSSCPCMADKSNFPAIADYSSADFKPTGAKMVTQCPKNPFQGTDVKDTLLAFVGLLEEEFQCSGLCTKEKWYYFSDVSKGQPKYKCQDRLLIYIDSKQEH